MSPQSVIKKKKNCRFSIFLGKFLHLQNQRVCVRAPSSREYYSTGSPPLFSNYPFVLSSFYVAPTLALFARISLLSR